MNGQESKAEIFDVFLCHNSEDKPAVREIALDLVKEGIKPWLDETDIRAGGFWHTTIGQQIESVKSAAVFVGASGAGPWQSREIIALLGEFDKRGCSIIPVVLPSDSPKSIILPWSLKGYHGVDFRTDSQPLKRLIWGVTGQKPVELADICDSEKPATMREAVKPRLIAGRHAHARSDNVFSEERLYLPLAQPPDPDNAAQLSILRRRVTEYWVDGVLKHSLYNEVLISLGKQEMGHAVDAPWKYTVERSDATNSAPLDDRDLRVIYDTTGLLLILGEPGSGKTTTLLDLARTLLERAQNDITERVPVVLNLSSWKKQPLADWISNELSEKYRVPRKIASFWLQRDFLLPLLDGLDEIEISTQPDCVSAIHAFIEEFRPSGLVVCCRLNEYRWLPQRLKLNGALCIKPLSHEEVSKYLDAGGSKLATLREVVDADPVLRELAQTPLMLSIMSLATQKTDGNELARQKGNPEERRKQVFRLYVEQMFQRKGTTSLVFPKEKIIHWLSWLARKMREHSQSVFLVEGLQQSWLGSRAKRIAYATIVNMIYGLLFGLVVGLFLGPVFHVIPQRFHWLWVSLICTGLILLRKGLSGRGFKLVGPKTRRYLWRRFKKLPLARSSSRSLNRITSTETLGWKWSGFWKKTIFGLIIALLVFWPAAVFGGQHWAMLGLSFAVLNGLHGGLTSRVSVEKASPNQGIRLSLKNSVVLCLVTWLTFGLIFGLFGGLGFGLILGLNSGLSVGLDQGGFAVIKHYTLRLLLCGTGDTALDFVKFLDQCAKLILLKKVGGGYIFIHRMLLDYFADLPQSAKVRGGKTGPVPD